MAVAGGLFKTNMLISSGNWPGLQGPHEVHLCQGHREGQRALAAGHGLHLFLEVQVVLEALVDQEAPCGNIVVYIFFLDLSLLKSTLLIFFFFLNYPDDVTVEVFESRPESIRSVLKGKIRVNIYKVCDPPHDTVPPLAKLAKTNKQTTIIPIHTEAKTQTRWPQVVILTGTLRDLGGPGGPGMPGVPGRPTPGSPCREETVIVEMPPK